MKTYNKPALQALQIASQSMICGSSTGGDQTKDARSRGISDASMEFNFD